MNQTLRLSSLAIVVGALLALTPASASANAAASPTSLAFGSTSIGTNSAAQTTTVTVTCSFLLPPPFGCITPGHFKPSPGFGGANPADFHATNDCGAGVTSPGSCTFTVTFTPTGAGARTATMSLGAEDSGLISVPITKIALSGTGVGPPPALSPPATGTRKKCKKHKKRSAAEAKKKCKKKRAR
jgi:hypothetical protein